MLVKFIIAALMVNSIYAKDVIEKSDYCSINWSKGVISCQGESAEGQKKFRAKRSAVVVAQRNLLELIKGVRIDSVTTIKDGMLESDMIKSSVSGMIKGAQIISNKYNREYKSSVATLEISIGKDLRKALMSDKNYASWNQSIKQVFTKFFLPTQLNAQEVYSLEDEATLEKLIKDFKEKGNIENVAFFKNILKQIKNNSYSGLLVDARDIGDIKVALNMKIVDKKGKEIYPGKYATQKQFVGKNGVSVGLDFDMDDAKSNKRVFDVPLVVKSNSIYKKRCSDIVLDDKSIERLKLITSALHKAKVIVVVAD